MLYTLQKGLSMSKATKLRQKALNRKNNQELQSILKDKLTSKKQTVKSTTPTTLSNGQKGVTLTFN
jgi:hypothetical protein